ncbi:MFS transporter [Sphingomonadaceae bacterium G21617-S1]|nr:MFS transporter [Sphingomonadaceae bacterium G21617-S1]
MITKWDEFRRSWVILLASTFGTGVGISGLLAYNVGLFANDLSNAIGISRTQFGLIYFGSTIAIAAGMPIVGWLVDRYGVRWPAILGAALLSSIFVSLALLVHSVIHFAILMILAGFLGSLSTSVGFTRAVSASFEKGRGLALGITQAGVGLSASIVPLVTAAMIEGFGWRAGFLTLAGIAALGIPSAFIALRERAPTVAKTVEAPEKGDFAAVRRTRLFWMQFVAFSMVTLTFSGILIHFVPLLRDAGIPMAIAASYAGLMGLSVLVSRIVVGWLADIVHAPWLAATACMMGCLGCLILLGGSRELLPLAAIAIGCAVGAEVDLLGYLTARNFGLGVYGRAYAWQYGGVICGSGASPAWVGWVADHAGYDLAAGIAAALSLVATLLFMKLPGSAELNTSKGSSSPSAVSG